MEIAKLSQNDDLLAVIRKCNVNFQQLALSARQAIKKQSKIDMDNVSAEISGITQTLVNLENVVLPQMVSDEVDAKVPTEVATQIAAADIPGQVANALDQALGVTMTSTLSDFFTEDGCTVTACNAMKWGDMAFIRFSYRLNSTLTVPSNGDITDVTLGKLKVGWRPFDMTNVILDQTRIIIGDVDSSGDVKARSANSRGTSYTIDANAVLYASMMLMLGLQ